MTLARLRWLARRPRWVRNRLRNLAGPPKLVLLYHRVTDLPQDYEQLAVTPQHFRAQVEYLSRHFEVERFEHCHERWDNSSVVITFDDGYADNYLEALPILEEFGVPATFFVATDNIDSAAEFWWDDLARCIFEGAPAEHKFSVNAGNSILRIDLSDRAGSYQRAARTLHTSPPDMVRECLDRLRTHARVSSEGRPGYRVLSLTELKALADAPMVTIGAHSLSHPCLRMLPEAEQRMEIEQSLYRLREWTGKEVPVFSYPFGDSADYNEASIEICKSLGFVAAAANNNRVYRSFHSRFEIPRLLVRNWSSDEFAHNLEVFRSVF